MHEPHAGRARAGTVAIGNGTAGILKNGRDLDLSQNEESGLRGRGGAGLFPTGLKVVLHAQGKRRSPELSGGGTSMKSELRYL